MSDVSYLYLDLVFDQKLERIAKTTWIPLRLIQIGDLISLLEQQLPPSLIRSFTIELFPVFMDSIERFNSRKFCSLNPLLFEKLLSFFYPLYEHFDELQITHFNKFLACAIKINLQLIEPEKILELVSKYNWLKDSGDAHQLEGTSQLDVLTDLRTKSDMLNRLDEIVNPDYISLINNKSMGRQAATSKSINGLFVVTEDEISAGMLATIYLNDILISDGLPEDQIRFSSHAIKENDILNDQTHNVCRYLRKVYNPNPESKIKLNYYIDQPTSTLTGNSIGLALGILGLIGINQYNKFHTAKTQIYDDVAVTGAISSSGQVTEIDEGSLKLKIEAAFYSQINTVVVPDSQFEVCQSYLLELKKIYPKRSFKIIPVKQLPDILEEREVTVLRPVNLSGLIKQTVKLYSNVVLIISFIIAMISLSAIAFGVVNTHVPDSITAEDGYFHIKNKFGFELWEAKIFNSTIDSDLSNFPFAKQTSIVDLDQDGTEEVIIGNGLDTGGRIVCYNQDGSARWYFDTGAKLNSEITPTKINSELQ